MSANSGWSSTELVPLRDRLRYMLLVRAVLIAAIGAGGAFGPKLIGVLPPGAFAVLGAWAGVSLLAELVLRLSRDRGLPLLGLTMIVDGLALVWLSTVGNVTNVRYLIFMHMVAVVLLASYRTGLKVAMWYALLLYTVFFAGRNRAFGLSPVHPGTMARWDLGQVAVLVGAVWLVAVAAAAFSSVNERELRRRRFDLEALAGFAVALEGAADRRAVAETLLDNLADAFPVGRLLLVTAGLRPVVLGHRHTASAPADVPSLELYSALLRAAEEHQTLLVAGFDAEADPWLSRVMAGGRNFMLVPLHAEGGCVGVLVAEHAARKGSRVERRMVSIVERFASHAALALRNAGLLEEMERMVSTDGLTHIANRRTFEVALEKEVARSIRTGEPVSLVMLDIDHFKVLNDTYGHQVGDEVLRVVAAALRTASRDMDTVARYGGEEFAVILSGCGPEDALASADRLHRSVSDASSIVPVALSVGVATLPDNASTGAGLVRAADTALYQAKRAGRDQVHVAGNSDDMLPALGPSPA